MAIRVTLDRMLLERRMSLTELCDRVGITMANLSILKDRQGQGGALLDPGSFVQRAEMPARRSSVYEDEDEDGEDEADAD
jgi:putative transcriptional regulator